MPFVDLEASALVRQLREDRGLSPEAMAEEIAALIRREGWHKLQGVHAYTIRRIEGNPDRGIAGLVPGVRVRVVVARYFDIPAHEIWKSNRRVKVAA